ncbi:hypothetical protein [Kribbella sp. NPDC004875]|uniref:hypothetical protein n=1 Tax=Kribbella sp. NPDC004875 TaxID=3364107 RepID=UPI00369A587B
MNTELEPPRVPPLTAAERSRMRNQLMERTRPGTRRPARHWVAPLVGVAAVGAVVAGTLVVTHKSPDHAGVAGTSTPAPTLAYGAAKPQARVGVDLGAVPQAQLAKVVTECQFPTEPGPAELVWSRHVRGISKDSTALVGLARDTKGATPKTVPGDGGRRPGAGSGGLPSSASLGYRYCLTRTPPLGKLGSIGTVGRVDDKAWRTDPTVKRGLVALGGSDGDFTNDLHTLQAWRIYRALPGIAKVEARYVLDGKPGPWTSGVVDGGFAYTEVQASGTFTSGQHLKTEVRAFDAHGRQLLLT